MMTVLFQEIELNCTLNLRSIFWNFRLYTNSLSHLPPTRLTFKVVAIFKLYELKVRSLFLLSNKKFVWFVQATDSETKANYRYSSEWHKCASWVNDFGGCFSSFPYLTSSCCLSSGLCILPTTLSSLTSLLPLSPISLNISLLVSSHCVSNSLKSNIKI